MILRHTRAAIFLHWFNAFCWLFLLFTGFALLGEHVQPIGQWWHDLWHGLFGARGLLYAHIGVGSTWIAVYAIALLVCGRSVVWPFLSRVFRFSLATDCTWCIKKGLWLTLGPKKTSALGIDPALPPQGFYNAGQRLVAVLAVLSSLGLALTGVMLAFFSGETAYVLPETALQWSIAIHFCLAALMAIFLPIHIYMAALAPGEGPALRSMFTGYVPNDFVEHHNPLWNEELLRKNHSAPESPRS